MCEGYGRPERAGNGRMPVGFSHLLLQAVHGGREPHVQKHGRIDVSGFGMGRGVIEKTGQIAEIRHEHADGSFVERDGHDFNFSGWHRRDIWFKSAPSLQSVI
jgi:hypothetical protein